MIRHLGARLDVLQAHTHVNRRLILRWERLRFFQPSKNRKASGMAECLEHSDQVEFRYVFHTVILSTYRLFTMLC